MVLFESDLNNDNCHARRSGPENITEGGICPGQFIRVIFRVMAVEVVVSCNR